jgi:hypothetical protein
VIELAVLGERRAHLSRCGCATSTLTYARLVHIDKDWVPVVSGLVGAAGAILAQVASAYFTGRRETGAARARRLEVRASAFANEKRLLFVRTLETFDGQIKAYEKHVDAVESGDAVGTIPTGAYHHEGWGALAAEIDLMAPDVVKVLNSGLKRFFDFDFAISLGQLDQVKDHLTALRADRVKLRDAMRLSMNVEDEPQTTRRAWGDKEIPIGAALAMLLLVLLLWVTSALA